MHHYPIDDTMAAKAARQLSRSDPSLAPTITKVGLCPIRPHGDYYRSLCSSIIGQQLSVKAAASIRQRFIDHFSGDFPTPAQIAATPEDELRQLGLSRAKVRYLHDLSEQILDGRLTFSRFDELSNQAIIDRLLAVKGIGEWTAHMFLMFCMGRSDILPYGDLGVRNGLQKLHGLTSVPDRAETERIANRCGWHPYETIASWYVWQSLDNQPV